MNRVVFTHTLNGSTQALSVPTSVKYLQLRNRNASTWRIGYDSTGTNYWAMAATDIFEVPFHEGNTIQQVYVYGTAGHVLEGEYWT